MPLTDQVAGRQTGGPAPLTITDLQYHARCVGERGGGRCDNAMSWHFLGCKRCEGCKGPDFAINTVCTPSCWYGPYVGSAVVFMVV